MSSAEKGPQNNMTTNKNTILPLNDDDDKGDDSDDDDEDDNDDDDDGDEQDQTRANVLKNSV